MNDRFATPAAADERLARWCRRSMVLRSRRAALEALLGPTEGQTCLEIGAGALGALLRRRGGAWFSAEFGAAAAERLRRLYGESAGAIGEDGRLPFPEGHFDAVVVVDTLERRADDVALIEQVHRALKPAGRLVIETPFHKPSPLHPLRRLLGFTDARLGQVRPGYREAELYEVLKDGFDVQEVRVFSGFFAEAFEYFARRSAERRVRGPTAWTAEELSPTEFARLMRIYGGFFPLAWTGALLDRAVPFRGHRIALRAKRRLWIPRKTPILRDGRSIAEAALRTRIGTASPLAEIQREQKLGR